MTRDKTLRFFYNFRQFKIGMCKYGESTTKGDHKFLKPSKTLSIGCLWILREVSRHRALEIETSTCRKISFPKLGTLQFLYVMIAAFAVRDISSLLNEDVPQPLLHSECCIIQVVQLHSHLA